MMSIQTHRFSNGFQYIVQQLETTHNKSMIYMLCEAGSIFEPDDKNGMAHIVEHLLFMTKSGKQSSSSILQHFDSMGVQFNAHTVKQFTIFKIECLTTFLPKCIEMLGYILLQSRFDKETIDLERNVVDEENVHDLNTIQNVAYASFSKLVFSGIYKDLVDTSNSKRFHYTVQELHKFYKSVYKPSRIIMSVVSSISLSTVHDYITKSAFTKGQKTLMENKKETIIRNTSLSQRGYHPNIKNTHNSYVMVGFPICGFTDEKGKVIFEFTKRILNMLNGRLFRILRAKEGLAYRFFAETEFETTQGYFSINVHTVNQNVIRLKKGVVSIIFRIFKDLVENGFTDEELKKGKEHLKRFFEMKSREVSCLAEYNAHELFAQQYRNMNSKNHVITPYNEMFDQLFSQITNEELRQYFHKYFVQSNVIISITGKSPPSHETVRRIGFRV
jgi:predicted Zn-dependent peptidase